MLRNFWQDSLCTTNTYNIINYIDTGPGSSIVSQRECPGHEYRILGLGIPYHIGSVRGKCAVVELCKYEVHIGVR